MQNRNGLLLDACLTQADGHAERIAAAAHDRAARRSAAGDHAGRRKKKFQNLPRLIGTSDALWQF
jgi:hypothetical protein